MSLSMVGLLGFTVLIALKNDTCWFVVVDGASAGVVFVVANPVGGGMCWCRVGAETCVDEMPHLLFEQETP